jgi:hypothetical protein
MVYSVLLDGSINEVSWHIWFSDSGTPLFSTYYSSDETYAYIGIITSSIVGDNDLEFAFKGTEHDWVIKLADVSGLSYKMSEITNTYWGPSQTGLPDGVKIIKGLTDGKISYEIRIEKDLLGEYGKDIPDNLNIWIMVANGSHGQWIWSIIDIPEGEVNFYPEARADWWFTISEEEDQITESVPSFSAPELPIGTITSIILMLTAMLVISKKQSLSNF